MEKIKAADFTIYIFSGQIKKKNQKDIKIIYIYIYIRENSLNIHPPISILPPIKNHYLQRSNTKVK